MSKAKIRFRGVPQVREAVIDPTDNYVEVNGKHYSADELSLDVPVAGTLYGALLNYKGAVASLGEAVNEPPYKEAPKAPVLYIKPENTFTGYGMSIPKPSDVPELEIGAALGVVIGTTATRISESKALDYVAGYTVVNDVSIPHESLHRPAIKQKARDGFCPIGPWVIERDAIPNPDDLDIRVFVNGELKQENTTANLIRPVARLIADVTDFMTLYEGDTLLIGVPEGAPLAKMGDRVRVDIEGIGSLDNVIANEDELGIGGIL